MALTDVTRLSTEPAASVRFDPKDATEHLRVVSVQDRRGARLLMLADSFREAELLTCGLGLLLERETTRLGIRGGEPVVRPGGAAAAPGAVTCTPLREVPVYPRLGEPAVPALGIRASGPRPVAATKT